MTINWTSPSNFCSGDLTRPSCGLFQDDIGMRDGISTVRMVLSFLGIIGSFSIIVSAVYKRRVFSPEVHPIFILSIADALLALLWVTGCLIWFRDPQKDRVGCFTVVLMTMILECITVNLTLVYALFAYTYMKKQDFTTSYVLFDQGGGAGPLWHPCKTAAAYCIAWFLPVVLIMIPFGAIAGATGLVRNTNSCSCWCIPYYGNVLPWTLPYDKESASYLHNMRKFVVSYTVVVGTHYLVAFLIMITVYIRILRAIRRMARQHEQTVNTQSLYGATEAHIIRRQDQAKTRVMAFLTIFVICGFFNMVFAYGVAIHNFIVIFTDGPKVIGFAYKERYRIPSFVYAFYMLESFTVPLQGFLNAIVYGWTRESFVNAIGHTKKEAQITGSGVSPTSPSRDNFFQITEEEESEIVQSAEGSLDPPESLGRRGRSSHAPVGRAHDMFTLSESEAEYYTN